MAEQSIREAGANTAQSISEATQATAMYAQKAGQATTHRVIEKATEYKDVYTTINDMVQHFWERVPYLIIAFFVFMLFWLVARLFKYFMNKALSNRLQNKKNLTMVLNRIGGILIVFVGFMIALVVAIPGFKAGQLVSALGIGSVAIGFAFKDIFQNLLSGILILLGEPFRIGDSIIVNGMEGTVEDIQVRATFLRSYDGRRLVIPNATVYTSPITVNTAYTQRRCEFVVGIGYDDDVNKAKQIIIEILNNDRLVLSQPAFTVIMTALADFSVNLTVRWWINTQETNIGDSVSEIQEKVKEAFTEQGINIPYPIQELKMTNNSAALPMQPVLAPVQAETPPPPHMP
jgi:small-conductance mechanosensitive channel